MVETGVSKIEGIRQRQVRVLWGHDDFLCYKQLSTTLGYIPCLFLGALTLTDLTAMSTLVYGAVDLAIGR